MRKILLIAVLCLAIWLLVMIMLASQPPRAMAQVEPTMLSTSQIMATYTPVLRPWPPATSTPEPTAMIWRGTVYLPFIHR